MIRRSAMLLFALLLGGCALFSGWEIEELYGEAQPRDRMVGAGTGGGTSYHDEVAPILHQRCVVCHACYDAPCQLNLASAAGIDRGASKDVVYSGERLLAASLSRLFEDAGSTHEWREKGFYPVLNEHEQIAEANLDASVLYQMLALKRRHPLPDALLLDDTFELGLDRGQVCPTIDEWPAFATNKPLWGMPYGLPGLTDGEFSVLTDWLRDGAPMAEKATLGRDYEKELQRWEEFLNGDSTKQQLMARYIYEHWFLAHLYFSDLGGREFFRLVRSATPPGQPIERISTRRPYDDPGVDRVYYRLWREQGAIVDKTHMPYALDAKRLSRLRTLFLDADYRVERLPDYEPETASNPFVAFEAIPIASRWRFILEESRFTIMNFIKGPVCRGQIALDVINDHFWVFFISPEYEGKPDSESFLASQKKHLRLPAESESNAGVLLTWLKYSHSQEEFLEAKTKWLNEHATSDIINLDLIWNGDGHNPNAALTVFRHFDSASVVHGMVGKSPKTAWLVDYSLLERIHYLLVAGFDVYGNVGHQLNTRLYMDFLRMEGEFNFLALLPKESRKTVRNQWYRGASDSTKAFIHGKLTEFQGETGIAFKTDDTKEELFGMIQRRLAPVLYRDYDLSRPDVPAAHREQLERLQNYRGMAASYLPQLVFLTVMAGHTPHYYTVIHDNAHSNITSVLNEASNRVPAEDDITVVRGFLGAYPGAFWQVEQAQLGRLVDTILALQGEADYRALMDAWGIRRTDPRFWSKGDELYAAYLRSRPIDGGLFDFNRLENR